MPGSHTFCFSNLQATFFFSVPILYNAAFLVSHCCHCTYLSGHGFQNRILKNATPSVQLGLQEISRRLRTLRRIHDVAYEQTAFLALFDEFIQLSLFVGELQNQQLVNGVESARIAAGHPFPTGFREGAQNHLIVSILPVNISVHRPPLEEPLASPDEQLLFASPVRRKPKYRLQRSQ